MLIIDVEENGKAVIIKIKGDMSQIDNAKFDQSFKKYLNSEFKVIALDLKNIRHLDSFGMSRIIKISRMYIGNGMEFVLINMNEEIFHIFRIATFDKIYKIMTEEIFFQLYIKPVSNS